MNTKAMLAAALLAALSIGGAAKAAVPVFVGSWEVDQGPGWYQPPNGPLAYTGQEAAALLFGGSASDYVISTVDNQVGDIDFQAWYSVIGVGGGHIFAQDYATNKYLGQFYGPSNTYNCCGDAYTNTNAASSYVADNAIGADFTNFAFRVGGGVPEPATWALMIGGFGLAGAALRRRRAAIA